MRFTLLTLPGRGDTEPFIALGKRLLRDGHDVKLAARPDVADLVEERRIAFAPVGNSYQPFIAGAAKAGAVGSSHPWRKLTYGVSQRRYVSENLANDAFEAAQGTDAIIYKWPWISGHTIAEKLGVPCIPVMLLPLLPTSVFPSFLMGRGGPSALPRSP